MEIPSIKPNPFPKQCHGAPYEMNPANRDTACTKEVSSAGRDPQGFAIPLCAYHYRLYVESWGRPPGRVPNIGTSNIGNFWMGPTPGVSKWRGYIDPYWGIID